MKDIATIASEPAAPSQPSFQQLLAAAFIVQEHNDKLQSSNDPDAAYTRTLAEIVETERLIQDARVDFQTALELIAERTHTITRADGVALGLLENGKLVYHADTGDSAGLNAPVLITASLAAECFRTGKALQSPESRGDNRIDQPLRLKRGVESLLAVPIRDEGKISGVLELRYKRPRGFQANDLRTVQLMCGLIGEVLAGKVKQGWKQALASSEEQAMRLVLDHIQPELDRFEESDDEFQRAVSGLTAGPHSLDLTERPHAPKEPAIQAPQPPAKSEYSETLCVRCGHAFAGDEAFCGVCGAMRSEDSPVMLTPKTPAWTSLWDMQESKPASQDDLSDAPANGSSNAYDADFEATISRLSDQPELEEEENSAVRFAEYELDRATPLQLQAAADNSNGEDSEKLIPSGPGMRIATLWRQQRATLYLAASLGLLVVVLLGWAMQPDAPVAPAQTIQQASAQPELSVVDKMLIGMGLAEAPSVPVHQGDPNVRVWVDVHTALYYCAGAELFGKTKDGRFTKQRDAQLDQFQPAARKACD